MMYFCPVYLQCSLFVMLDRRFLDALIKSIESTKTSQLSLSLLYSCFTFNIAFPFQQYHSCLLTFFVFLPASFSVHHFFFLLIHFFSHFLYRFFFSLFPLLVYLWLAFCICFLPCLVICIHFLSFCSSFHPTSLSLLYIPHISFTFMLFGKSFFLYSFLHISFSRSFHHGFYFYFHFQFKYYHRT